MVGKKAQNTKQKDQEKDKVKQPWRKSKDWERTTWRDISSTSGESGTRLPQESKYKKAGHQGKGKIFGSKTITTWVFKQIDKRVVLCS